MVIKSDEFQLIRRFLADGAFHLGDINIDEILVPCHKRLVRAFKTGTLSSVDLASLVRHILRRESERQGGRSQTIRVPVNSRWPNKEQWAQHGIRASQHSSGDFVLEAKPWKPSWLPFTDGISPEATAFGETLRRKPDLRDGDPFLETFGYVNYFDRGQKEAVRAVLMAPEGSTLVVNLPTGNGKSLCAHILTKIPFINGEAGGITIVVAPTTALALDQERAVRHLCFPTAFRSAMDEEIKSSNQEIWRGVCNGTQSIVFTSPESLMGGLRNAVYSAAERGLIKALVVDEAHMVEQWGDEFRSAFQQITGLRRALLRKCPTPKFRTILLSATLTESTLDTLYTLFGKPGPFEIVSAVQLRPEPAYWISRCESENQKTERVLDAIRHLPRPLILYTTEVDDANHWFRRLKQNGYQRLAVMTGRTGPSERNKIINSWAATDLDMIVATSAFGLGVDQKEVRAVVHACVPETLDRFYQEVGRGGRDGNASISLLVYTQDDLETAKSLNQKRIITVKKGLPRWKRMFSDKIQMFPDLVRFEVPIDVAPSYNYNLTGLKNTDWNIKTLTLMNRAGIIALDDEYPLGDKTTSEEENTGPATEVLEQPTQESEQQPRCVVEILENGHLSEELWNSLVEPLRERTAKSKRQQLKLLRELLKEKQCAGEILAQAYSVPANSESTIKYEVHVEPSCGGCGYCRAQEKTPHETKAYVTSAEWPPYTSVETKLAKYLAGNDVLAIFFSTKDDISEQNKNQSKLLIWLIQQGIRCLIDPKSLLTEFCSKEPLVTTLPIMIEHSYRPRRNPKVPTALFHPVGQPIRDLEKWLSRARSLHGYEAPLILILPEDANDPEMPDRLLSHILPCNCLMLEQLFIREVL